MSLVPLRNGFDRVYVCDSSSLIWETPSLDSGDLNKAQINFFVSSLLQLTSGSPVTLSTHRSAVGPVRPEQGLSGSPRTAELLQFIEDQPTTTQVGDTLTFVMKGFLASTTWALFCSPSYYRVVEEPAETSFTRCRNIFNKALNNRVCCQCCWEFTVPLFWAEELSKRCRYVKQNSRWAHNLIPEGQRVWAEHGEL